ncbi:MAG: acyl-ACP--UDP-N-acetylglucosamine O-acyltransferase [bacterium]|nr:acyl-ACP--UDP-N-acetylglucosamine O-acyltransferase [bacterium]
MTNIHATALVSSDAKIGDHVSIGPFSIVEAGVTVGDGCQIAARVSLKEGVHLGRENTISEGAVLGGKPQHRTVETAGKLIIGDRNTIRENATIHRALAEDEATEIGNDNLIMINSHIAHDCIVGNNTIIANNALLAGHIIVEDHAYISGAAGFHQFVRVGAYALVGGQAHVTRDVPPYLLVDGDTTQVVGLNTIGLRRNGFTPEQLKELKAAYRVIYRSGLRWDEVLVELKASFTTGPAAAFHEFMKSGKRGFVQERRTPKKAALKFVSPDPADVRKAG